jgi:hypothetical protein
MRTLLITGGAAAPGALRDIVRRGSTEFRECAPAALRAAPASESSDRIVVWQSGAAEEVLDFAREFALQGEDNAPRVLIVANDPALLPSSFPSEQLFIWPRDEDRLRMAFMTGA